MDDSQSDALDALYQVLDRLVSGTAGTTDYEVLGGGVMMVILGYFAWKRKARKGETMKSILLGCLMLGLAGCSGGINPKLCVDTTMLPQVPGIHYPNPDKDAPTQRCGGFVLGVSMMDRQPQAVVSASK